MNPFGPQYGLGIKKAAFEVLKQHYAEHEEVIDRIANLVHNERDYEKFGKFIVALFETGFLKAVEDHKEVLERTGYRVTVTKPQQTNPNAPKLFQSEKSG